MTRHPTHHRRVVARPLAAAIAVALVYGQSAVAASIVVDVATDTSLPAQCSLRDALIASRDNVVTMGCTAGEAVNPDTITFNLPNPSTITLGAALPALPSVAFPGQDLIVQGPGPSSLIISIGSITNGFDAGFGPNAPNLTVEGMTLRSTAPTPFFAIRAGGGAGRSITVRNSVIDGSFFEALTFFTSPVLVENCSFTPSAGVGVSASGATGANTYVIRGSTFSGQTTAVDADSGFGGSSAALTIENSTFDGNSQGAFVLAADVRAFGYGGTMTLNLRNTTLTSDAGTGTSVLLETSAVQGGTVNATVDSALLFRPSGTNIDALVPLGTVTLTANDSLFSESVSGIPETVAGTGNQFGVANAGIAALADNGGLTQTRALTLGSPAINTGSNPATLTFDQRGSGFPRTLGAGTDIGAFEFAAPQNIQVFDPSNTTLIPDDDLTPSVLEGTDFGSTLVGTPVARTYVIRNTGDVPLAINGISSNQAAFTVSGIPASVAANSTATFTVTYNPAAPGITAANINVLSDDPDQLDADYNFAVTGTASTAQNVLVFDSANTLQIVDGDVTPSATDGTDFGATPFGSPVARTFTLRNTGSQLLTITGINSSAGNFTVSGVPASVAGGATATFTVTMNAVAAGPAAATITVASDDPDAADASYTFAVQGSVSAPRDIDLFDGTNTTPITDGDATPTAADGTDFGDVGIGLNSGAHTFTIRNSGSEPLLLTGITSGNPAFTLGGVPASVGAGATATFTVAFTPSVAGLASGTITINSNDPDAAEAQWTFAVQGNGVAAALVEPRVIPSLGEWGMALLAALLVAIGIRRRRSTDELPLR